MWTWKVLVALHVFITVDRVESGRPSTLESATIKKHAEMWQGKASKVPLDEEEVKDIQTKWKGDGSVQLNFTSHGRHHHLDLTDTGMNLSQVPVKLLGSSEETQKQVEEKLKRVKLMRDRKHAATVAFMIVDGQPSPLLQEGIFRLGKRQFKFKQNQTSGKTTASRSSVDDPSNLKVEKVASPHINKTRTKRSSPLPTTIQAVRGVVELVWIIDYSTVNKFNRLTTSDLSQLTSTDPVVHLMTYFAHLTTMMDDYFGTMNNDDVSVEVDLVGLVVLTQSTTYPSLVENHVTSGKYVEGSSVVQSLSTWLSSSEGTQAMPPYDHVMLATTYDLTNSGSTSTTAAFYSDSICDKDKSISVLEMSSLMVAEALLGAHVLGHSLGADHDGSGLSSGCSEDYYIMDPYNGDKDYLDFRFMFSCCSQRAFYATIHQKGECLLTRTANKNYHSSYDTNVATYLPGEIFSADDQCYIVFGTSACSQLSTFTSKCKRLHCQDPDSWLQCITKSRPAADGTSCGSGEWCLQGECVTKYNSRSPTASSCSVNSCYGFDENHCSSGYNRYNPDMVQCYSDSVKCDAVDDCTDGSDEWFCGSIERSCASGYFTCTTGISATSGYNRYCILESWKCDGNSDCTDGSDEADCSSLLTSRTCSSDEFACLTGYNINDWPSRTYCIPQSQVCDGHADCTDNSDESHSACNPASTQTCPAEYFPCTTGDAFNLYRTGSVPNYCIKFSKLCDGWTNCFDGSDESSCEERENCYICSDSNLCVTTAKECNLHCPYDWDCKRLVPENSATLFRSSHLTSLIYVAVICLVIYF